VPPAISKSGISRNYAITDKKTNRGEKASTTSHDFGTSNTTTISSTYIVTVNIHTHHGRHIY
jgi:uncharacterized protein (UPF0218 family)